MPSRSLSSSIHAFRIVLTDQSESSAPYSRPSSGFARPVRHTGVTPPITPFNQNFSQTQLNQIYGPQGAVPGQLPQQAPIGTRLSPTASDFPGQWQAQQQQQPQQQAQPFQKKNVWINKNADGSAGQKK